MHTCIHAYMHTHIHAYTHTHQVHWRGSCTHAYMHTHMHTCIHACIHTHTHQVHRRGSERKTKEEWNKAASEIGMVARFKKKKNEAGCHVDKPPSEEEVRYVREATDSAPAESLRMSDFDLGSQIVDLGSQIASESARSTPQSRRPEVASEVGVSRPRSSQIVSGPGASQRRRPDGNSRPPHAAPRVPSRPGAPPLPARQGGQLRGVSVDELALRAPSTALPPTSCHPAAARQTSAVMPEPVNLPPPRRQASPSSPGFGYRSQQTQPTNRSQQRSTSNPKPKQGLPLPNQCHPFPRAQTSTAGVSREAAAPAWPSQKESSR